jgi:RNA polymerase sigma factor (sigma-70 family)
MTDKERNDLAMSVYPLMRLLVKRQLFRHSRDVEFYEDYVQDCMLCVVQSAAGWRPEDGEFTTYISSVAWQTVRRLRGRYVGPVKVPITGGAIPDSVSLDGDLAYFETDPCRDVDSRDEVMNLISRLPARDRSLLVKVYGLDGTPRTFEAAGAELNLCGERIRKLHDRAITKLQAWRAAA